MNYLVIFKYIFRFDNFYLYYINFLFNQRNFKFFFICMATLRAGFVVVDEFWMQTHSGFDFPDTETKSHCSAHHGCGYVRINTQKRACCGLHLPSGS